VLWVTSFLIVETAMLIVVVLRLAGTRTAPMSSREKQPQLNEDFRSELDRAA